MWSPNLGMGAMLRWDMLLFAGYWAGWGKDDAPSKLSRAIIGVYGRDAFGGGCPGSKGEWRMEGGIGDDMNAAEPLEVSPDCVRLLGRATISKVLGIQ